MNKLFLGMTMLFYLLVVGCSNVGTISFSLTENDEDIGERQNSFEISDDKIYMLSKLTGKTGLYRIVIEQNDKVYDDFNFEVPPDWKGFSRPLYLPNTEGAYTVKIFTVKDEVLVSKGSFQLKK